MAGPLRHRSALTRARNSSIHKFNYVVIGFHIEPLTSSSLLRAVSNIIVAFDTFQASPQTT